MSGVYNPICVPCKQEMRCDDIGATVNEPSTSTVPAKFWYADKYVCPTCGHELITGFGQVGLSAEELTSEERESSIEFKHA